VIWRNIVQIAEHLDGAEPHDVILEFICKEIHIQHHLASITLSFRKYITVRLGEGDILAISCNTGMI